MRKRIKEGNGLLCKAEELTWNCADDDDKRTRQCHKCYNFELWCNSKNPKRKKDDNKLKYVPDGNKLGDGRFPGPNGSRIGYDGNWEYTKLIG